MPFFTTVAAQIAGGQPEHISKIAKLLENETSSDFVDLNCGCPLDTICNRCVQSADVLMCVCRGLMTCLI